MTRGSRRDDLQMVRLHTGRMKPSYAHAPAADTPGPLLVPLDSCRTIVGSPSSMSMPALGRHEPEGTWGSDHRRIRSLWLSERGHLRAFDGMRPRRPVKLNPNVCPGDLTFADRLPGDMLSTVAFGTSSSASAPFGVCFHRRETGRSREASEGAMEQSGLSTAAHWDAGAVSLIVSNSASQPSDLSPALPDELYLIDRSNENPEGPGPIDWKRSVGGCLV